MKCKDAIRDKQEWDRQQKTISDRWDSLSSWRSDSLKRVTNYLFILNSGALWSSLAYLTKPEIEMTILLRSAISYFGIGTILILVHATIDYYMSERSLHVVDKNLSEYYKDKLDWKVVRKKIHADLKNDLCIDIVGWGSGIAFVLGLAFVFISFL